ncbi:MAG: DUF692 family protein [Phycisphaerae bacterium]|nr:DUF692 family protein [Phycisphaerae bacterium]
MTQFAINYSPEAEALHREGIIGVDLFKCPDKPEIIEAALRAGPCYVHFRIRAGCGPLDEPQVQRAAEMLELTRTAALNMHISPNVRDFPGMDIDTRSEDDQRRVREAIVRDIRHLMARFADLPIVLENLPYTPHQPYAVPRPALEPALIDEVVRTTSGKLLLDITHAAMAAKYFGVDERDYLAALPGELIHEIHISGTQLGEDGLWMDHYALRDEDWRLIEWVFDRIRRGEWRRPRVATLEYGGMNLTDGRPSDRATIAQEAPRLGEMIRWMSR